MLLWIVLTFMVAVAVSGLTLALVRRRDAGHSRATVTSILAAQLADVELQVAAGELSAGDAGPLRNEIRRRILAEGKEPVASARPVPANALPWLAIGIAGVVALAATGLYAMLGRPDLAANVPVQAQPAQDAAAAAAHPGGDVSAMIAQLEAKMQRSPNDPEGWRMLGWSYLSTGHAAEAATAYARAVALAPQNADYRSADGEALVRAADGQVTPSALDAFRAALKDDPKEPRARYYLALYKDQTGDHEGAMADWIALIKGAPADAPWLADVRRFVENVARDRGLNISAKLPPVSPAAAENGPSAADVQAANQMPAADREAMIHAMVDRLAGELKANPRNEEGWERLIHARMVLGETAAAVAAYREAMIAFADAPAEKTKLRESARSSGVPGS
jgi:cytochrome c-type biogenesis protein CcmH